MSVLLIIVFVFLSCPTLKDGAFVVVSKPKNMAVNRGQSLTLSCRVLYNHPTIHTSSTAKILYPAPDWVIERFTTKSAYVEQIYSGHRLRHSSEDVGRFSGFYVSMYNTTGDEAVIELIIHPVRLADAGIYWCAEHTSEEKAMMIVTVLESNPVCNLSSESGIMRASCHVSYMGPWAPSMTCYLLTERGVVHKLFGENVTIVTTNSNVTYSVKFSVVGMSAGTMLKCETYFDVSTRPTVDSKHWISGTIPEYNFTWIKELPRNAEQFEQNVANPALTFTDELDKGWAAKTNLSVETGEHDDYVAGQRKGAVGQLSWVLIGIIGVVVGLALLLLICLLIVCFKYKNRKKRFADETNRKYKAQRPITTQLAKTPYREPRPKSAPFNDYEEIDDNVDKLSGYCTLQRNFPEVPERQGTLQTFSGSNEILNSLGGPATAPRRQYIPPQTKPGSTRKKENISTATVAARHSYLELLE